MCLMVKEVFECYRSFRWFKEVVSFNIIRNFVLLSYTFSNSVCIQFGESLLLNCLFRIPVRLSIDLEGFFDKRFLKNINKKKINDSDYLVIGAISEPIPGWSDNFNGPYGICIGTGKGILHTYLGDENVRLNVIPVDTVVQTILMASYYKLNT